MFKSLLKNILALAVFGLIGYLLYVNFGGVWRDLYNRYFPCQSPIVYNLGTFDNRFGISKKDFLADLIEAEQIWEKPLGRQLFTYNSEDTSSDVLKVNLIYDYREVATQKINNLGLAVSNTKASYDALRAKYDALQSTYAQSQKDYQQKVQEYRNGQVNISEIRNMEASLNQQVDNINALVDTINSQAHTLNINAAELNNIGATRGEQFTEGEYKENGINKEIDVYEFSTKDKLVRVLAHELGHALGLDHVSDPNAIMYYLNQNTSGKLTEADLAELKTVCKIK